MFIRDRDTLLNNAYIQKLSKRNLKSDISLTYSDIKQNELASTFAVVYLISCGLYAERFFVHFLSVRTVHDKGKQKFRTKQQQRTNERANAGRLSLGSVEDPVV